MSIIYQIVQNQLNTCYILIGTTFTDYIQPYTVKNPIEIQGECIEIITNGKSV